MNEPITASPELEEIKLHLDKLDKDVKEVTKQFVSIQRSLDAIYEDRDLLTDIANDISKVRGLVISADKHNEQLTKGVEYTVEKKTDEVKTEVVASSKEVKESVVSKVVHGVQKAFTKQSTTLEKKPWYQRLLFWLKPVTPNIAV